ncbi:MAG TPA: tyrosine-type recombinase/integrase [Gammaproteobacteria bacterium]|nr:tyrosine-type recombinase/integrase [Gammaproteobacteria bacterium]
MSSISRRDLHSGRAVDAQVLPPSAEALGRYLSERGYAPQTIAGYVATAAHFLRWSERSSLPCAPIDESAVARFLDRHIGHCDCVWRRSEDHHSARAALGHLLLVLRTLGMAPARTVITTPVDEEVRGFEEHLDHVRGLAPKTRRTMGRIVRELLWKRFHDRPVVISAITPEHLRRCFASLCERYRAPTSAGTVVSALRSYLRYRAAAGDAVGMLVSVLSSPANWQHASLPKSLADEELERLLTSLDWPAPAMRRSTAIVRCAVDLGLRSGEIAALSLDDIDWRAGTVKLRKTKSCREQLLPLPEPTGRVIAAYLEHERPSSVHRGIFVRRVAPHDRLVGADLVRKTIREAYRRASLPYTRSHLLRHTIARRLLEAGSSLKEVADVLRHRSLNTTLIYAKLDSRALGAVALPWPRSVPLDAPEVALSWPGSAP